MRVTLTLSDIITIIGVLVTIASVIWAMYERRQASSARKEAQRFRRLLLKQQIAQQFTQVPEYALTLNRHVRARKWDEAAEAALLLSAKLASLNGVQDNLIGASDKEQLAVALKVLSSLNQHLSGTEESIKELEENLLEACNFVLLSTTALETTLRIDASLGGNENV